MGAISAMDPVHFERFRDFLQAACGIYLAENKQYLVTTRVLPLLSHYGIANLGALVDTLERQRYSPLRDAVIDAMTTNETFWFRDTYPFDVLQGRLLAEQFSHLNSLKIWSAACSSGQEPLSISMAVEEFLQRRPGAYRGGVEILGTDLSPSMLETARKAEYDRTSVLRGLSSQRLSQFFDELPGERWRAKPAITRRIQYRAQNLQESYGGLGRFHVIFCRNVLIYFKHDLKLDILQRLHRSLEPGGILFLGASEGLAGAANLFEMVHCNPGIMYRALGPG